MPRISRRTALKGMGALAATAWAGPLLARIARAYPAGLDPVPFRFGVGSADPLPDRVLLWTRVDPGYSSVGFRVALADDPGTPDFGPSRIVASGVVPAGGDGTVHLDVALPEPARFYWYRFETADGGVSAPGRTKTAPAPGTKPTLRFAVASCQDLQAGYFHAWRHAAEQPLDAVLFLGDYIYEYGDDRDGFRPHDPPSEILTLSDYRRRYRNYRTDPLLREAHRLHPFVTIWDDHEVANDRWGSPPPGGAENHQANEGPYADRLAAAMQAFAEYVPVRRPDPGGQPGRIYRRLAFGDLVDLLMLDERSYRHQPIGSLLTNPIANMDPRISDPNRTILGAAQKAWFKDALRTSPKRWKLVGNQVMVAHLHLGPAFPDEVARLLADNTGNPPVPYKAHRDGIPINYDAWDGYQAERREILEFIRNPAGDVDPVQRFTGHPGRIGNVVVLTGDFHTSWVAELSTNPGEAPAAEPVATEFAGPSITSINLNELLGEVSGGPPFPHRSSAPLEALAMATNPHFRHVEVDSNGYMLVEVTDERVRTDYYYLVSPPGDLRNPVSNPDATVVRASSWVVEDGSARVQRVVG